jgi:magnesium transporter
MSIKVYRLNKNRNLEPTSITEFFAIPSSYEQVFWIDIAEPRGRELRDLFSPLQLHPLVIEECLDPATGSRLAPYIKSLLIKFPVQVSWENLKPIFVSVICLRNAIITVHDAIFPTFENIANELSDAIHLHSHSTSAILYFILDRLIDEDMAFVSKARQSIESLEETMEQESELLQTEHITELKRKVARLSITFEDQHYCFAALQTVESHLLDISDVREYYRDSISHLEYALRSIGRQQARLVELRQHHHLNLQEKTNKRLRLLTIISAIFLPLTLIAGIYGMNFKYMPEMEWYYSYPITILFMITIAIVLLVLFYRKGWFK